ncbi:MAG TPA: hypothetical protein DCW74_17155 [Alteromonas australica]|uniref:Uncharacterized protein n=1 Tax=Alteromonas australica TaxID=589873 RepID=A0A350P832_9ALTE|nr:hypothetical protein [Alteromonas australica]|tara:strand:- start:149 stop:466 length:318 start_codon:yes stop_codon:yes gene_type:complete
MEANEVQVVADLIDQLQRLHGYMTARRTVDFLYFECVNYLHGYVTEYPRLPEELAHYAKHLTLVYPNPNSDHSLLVYTGKKQPHDLCVFFKWQTVSTVYTEEAVR